MSDDCTPNAVFRFYMAHASSETEHQGDQRKGSPESKVFVEKHKVEDEVSDVDDPVFFVVLLESFGLKQSPEPFFEEGVNKQEKSKEPEVMDDIITNFNGMGKGDSANFKKQDAIKSDQEEPTDSQ